MFGAPRTASRAIAAAVSRRAGQRQPRLGARQQRLVEDRQSPPVPPQRLDRKPTASRPYRARRPRAGSLLFGRPVLRTRLAVGLAALLSLLVPTAAHAGDPIMPLAQVQSGMHCTGYSVIRGTDITSFDVEVLDVHRRRPTPQILVHASAVPPSTTTGIAEGFSGSPVKCSTRRRRRARRSARSPRAPATTATSSCSSRRSRRCSASRSTRRATRQAVAAALSATRARWRRR